MMDGVLWPDYDGPGDLAQVEAVPLADRGLPPTTYDLVARAAGLWPERVAMSVLTSGERWALPVERTFGQLLADVHRQANAFHSLGIRRGDGIALLAPNCEGLITATLAGQLAGIAVPINSAQSPEHIAELLRRSGARVLVAAGPDLGSQVWECARDLAVQTGMEALLALTPTGAGPAELEPIEDLRVAHLSALAADQPHDRFQGDPPGASDLAALFHTGGTTGTPKLAGHTHANEVSDAWMIAVSPLMREGAVVFAALPLFHVNAVHVTLLAPLFRGLRGIWAGPLGYRDPALFPNFWKIVQRYGVTTMSAVPTVYSVLANCPVDADITSMRYAVVGASPLPQAVRDGFESTTGIQLVEGYGLTEATCVSVLNFPGRSRPGSVGQRLPYQHLKAVKVTPDGEWVDLPAGEIGVLAISGPTVFPGYVVDAGPDGPVLDGLGKLRDSWLDTGDLAKVDDDGFVHLTGRAKDVIIRGGHNIDPAVIEAALLAHPSVTDAQAVGRPDLHAGEVPVAFVTLAPGSSTTEVELLRWGSDHVPEPAAAPKTVTVLDAIPVTPVGKPFKPALRAEATQGAVREALRDVVGVQGVRVLIERGTVAAVIEINDGADETHVKETLDRFAITWRMEKS
jgi:fatty-acyl-CoA synthase